MQRCLFRILLLFDNLLRVKGQVILLAICFLSSFWSLIWFLRCILDVMFYVTFSVIIHLFPFEDFIYCINHNILYREIDSNERNGVSKVSNIVVE